MKKKFNSYYFDKISSNMAKEFGTIKRGREDDYNMLFMPMEGNILKLYREDEKRNGRHATEAIHICLLTIDGYLNNFEYDFSIVQTEENTPFVTGLLMSFDPFTNPAIHSVVENSYDLKSPEDLRVYFKEPVLCLLRIEKSIETWSKEMGSSGYFRFLEGQIGELVKKDLEMNYSVMLKKVNRR